MASIDNNKNDNKKMFSCRLPIETINQINQLSTLSGLSQSEVIANCVFTSYDKINNNEETKKILEKINLIQEQLRGIDQLTL